MLFRKYLFPKDDREEKHTITLRIIYVLSIITVFIHADGLFTVIKWIIIGLVVFQVLSYFTRKRYGKVVENLKRVASEDIEKKLRDDLEGIDLENGENEFYLRNENFKYIKNRDIFYKVTRKRKATTSTQVYDLLSLIVIAGIVLSASLPIFQQYMSSQGIENISLFIAFLGAYVLSPFFPDLYYIVSFAHIDEVDVGDFVSTRDSNGSEIYGEINKVSFSHKIVYDYYNKCFNVIHHKLFSASSLKIYSNEDGRILEKSYVIDADDVSDVKKLCHDYVKEYHTKNKGYISYSEFEIYETDHNYGVKVFFRVPILNLRDYGRIKNEICTLISQKARKIELALDTPDRQEITIKKSK